MFIVTEILADFVIGRQWIYENEVDAEIKIQKMSKYSTIEYHLGYSEN